LNLKKLSDTSIIIPTFREAENLPELVDRISKLRDLFEKLTLIVVDDNSNDGTEEFFQKNAAPWLKLIVRKNERGLSSAVIRGFQSSESEILVAMDADLSHPPEKIPDLVQALSTADFALGSRYAKGGKVEEGWTAFRWINSKVATLLARPFTNIKDPMSGFFALRRLRFLEAKDLNPIGYKIALELIVKAHCKVVTEVPIFFADRKRGQSKLSLKEQLSYIRHLARLAAYKLH
jgi:dolichol-phosphate mannosyltransferase